jgi:AcrR family transcriptional regulator
MTEGKPPGGSIWTRPERAPRGPAPEHSRAKIAAAGLLIADADGLDAVTMRSVAAAVGTGPASLYRYVVNRGELIELMADQARGELDYATAADGPPVARLLAIAREGRALYLRHPWLLDVRAAPIPGPNAVTFIERALAALEGTGLTGPARLEVVGLFSGAVRLAAQTEIEQSLDGQDAIRWQRELAAYLTGIVSADQHPHLAAALAEPPAADGPTSQQDVFDSAMTRILAGLLSPPFPAHASDASDAQDSVTADARYPCDQELSASGGAGCGAAARRPGPGPSPAESAATGGETAGGEGVGVSWQWRAQICQDHLLADREAGGDLTEHRAASSHHDTDPDRLARLQDGDEGGGAAALDGRRRHGDRVAGLSEGDGHLGVGAGEQGGCARGQPDRDRITGGSRGRGGAEHSDGGDPTADRGGRAVQRDGGWLADPDLAHIGDADGGGGFLAAGAFDDEIG